MEENVVLQTGFLSMKMEKNPVKMEKNPVYEKWRKIRYIFSKKCRYLEIESRRP